ncbi:MAG TPA: lantibiotic dehydratase [Gemmatimonadales bacterium]
MAVAAGKIDFFVLRTPLLPVETLLDWSGELSARTSYEKGEPLAAALAADRALLRSRLARFLTGPEIREAIFVASPSLDEAFEHWVRDPDSEKGRRVEWGLVRYLCRMASRPTPFGLFAGISVGRIAKQTRLKIRGREANERHTRLDNDYLFALVQSLASDSTLRDALRYRPNDSLSPGAGRFRYVEARVDGTLRTYHLVSSDDTPELRSILAKAETGATRAELSEALVSPDVDRLEAEKYVDELISAQILVPDLELPVTGPEPLPTLIRELEVHPSQEATVQTLRAVDATLAEFDRSGGTAPARYRELAKSLEPLPAKAELATLFQVDLVKPAPELALGDAVLREIDRAIEILHGLGGLRASDPLARFREAFLERYEDREVPLLEALDDEVGLGATIAAGGDPSPLLRGIGFPESADTEHTWGSREHHQLTLLGAALQDGREEIVLEAKDLEKLAIPGKHPLAHSLELLITILAPSAEAIDRGEFRLCVDGVTGPPGARYLGRFCHVDDGLAKEVNALLRAEEEQHPEDVYAEIVHLPEGRMGNILLRPQLRSHEITYLGRSGAPRERQIPASDLLLSHKHGYFVLRSARLGRRIVPRLTTAHAYSRGLGVYRFLCLLQVERIADMLVWSWGPLANAPFLPRVRSGRFILCPRRWTLSQDECKRLGALTGEELFRAVQEWRTRRRLPRWIVLADYDNRLAVDLENVLAVEAFTHGLKNRDSATLEETHLASEEQAVAGPDGRYTHEIIVPIARTATSAVKLAEMPRPASAPQVQRSFSPGSEWLSIKLYCGESIADEILTEVIGPITQQLLEAGAAKGWFFLRYGDPALHLRWRLLGDPADLSATARPAVEEAAARLLHEGKIWRVQFDTYHREIERYGGPEAILLAEQLFQADSDAVFRILELLDPGDAGLDERWRLAVRGMDQLLADLGLDQAARSEYARRWMEEAFETPESSAGLRPQLSDRFRKERARLESLLDRSKDGDSDLGPGLAILHERSESLASIGAELRRLEREGHLWVPVAELAQSFVHMHVNRLLRSAQRQHEVILHDFLHRLYQAQAARAGAKRPAEELAQ